MAYTTKEFVGKTRHIICLHQEELIVLRVHHQAEDHAYLLCSRTPYQSHLGRRRLYLANSVQMIHDFCGGLEEELMRANFILIYELLDEMIVCFIDNISGRTMDTRRTLIPTSSDAL